MRLISTSQVKPDMVLARSIYNKGSLILAIGTDHLERYVNSLKRLGIQEIYVDDFASEGIEVPDVISIKTRNICKETLRRSFKGFAEKGQLQVDDVYDAIDKVLDEVLSNKDVLISLNDIGATDEYTYSHSVSTTVYALMLGQKLNYSRSLLCKLAMGTILHDIGKIYIDKDIMFKKGKLTDEEYTYVKKHTLLGYNALKSCSSISELSRQIALTHHEHVDGTGYPRGLEGDELHEFSKIVTIADVYDALTSTRCYRRRFSNKQAMDMITQSCGTTFETELVCEFLQLIAVYPNGTQIMLSDGRIGIVKDQNRGMPLRPIIRVIREADGSVPDFYDIDLMLELNVVIVEESDMEFEDNTKVV